LGGQESAQPRTLDDGRGGTRQDPVNALKNRRAAAAAREENSMSHLFSRPKASARYAALAFALSPFAANAEPIKLKFAFFASDREFVFRSVVKPFVDAVNLEGKGIVEIELFPSGALERSYPKQVQLVLSGGADFAWIHTALTPEQFPDNAVMEQPGMFHDAEEATQVYTRVAASGVLRGYEDLFLVASVCTAPLVIHMRTPAASLEDLKGKKIRSANQTEGTVLKALGMEPASIPINQVSDAINRGAVDGATAGLDVAVDFGISRFATNHYMLSLGIVPIIIAMNKRKFDSLPEAAQNIIRKYSGQWLTSRFVGTVNSYRAEILGQLKADSRRKVTNPSALDLDQASGTFKSAMNQWAAKDPRNGELLKTVEAEIAKFRSTR
jgi:TRAP-type transport system periplasmic protein